MPNMEKKPTTEFLPPICEVQGVLLLVLFAGGLAVLTSLLGSDPTFFDWQRFALVTLYMLWVVLLSAGLLCQLRAKLNAMPMAKAASISYALILLVVLLVGLVSQWFMASGISWRFDWLLLVKQILVAAILAGIGLRYAYLTQTLKQREKSELAARVQALQSRIKPHFLFNSMNTIASLIATSPEKAEQAVEDLSGLFRESLQAAEVNSTVAEELALCEQYFRIEQLRLGDRLNVDWQVDPEVLYHSIPRLMLQPLLENAVLHGIQDLPEGGVISVTIGCADKQLFCTVSNPTGSGEYLGGTQQGLANIKDRLAALYGEKAGLKLDNSGKQFVVHIHMPMSPAL